MSVNQNYILRYVKLHSTQQFQVYKLRQSCNHPSVPTIKIIAKKQNILCIQIQLVDRKLIDYIKMLQNEHITLQLLQEVIIASIYIRSKFGCFAVSESLIKINSEGAPKLWIHEDPVSIIRQIPLPNQKSGERAMIKSILAIFKPYISRYQNLIKLDNFEDLKIQLKKVINSHKSGKDTERHLAMTASKALFFLKNCQHHNVAAGTQRQNNTYNNHISGMISPRFSSTNKNQDFKLHQSAVFDKKLSKQPSMTSRRNLFQMMQLPGLACKKQIIEENLHFQVNVKESDQKIKNSDSQSLISTFGHSRTLDEPDKHLKQAQFFNCKSSKVSKTSNINNSLLEAQFNDLFGEEDNSQYQFGANCQVISEQVQNDFNFVFL